MSSSAQEVYDLLRQSELSNFDEGAIFYYYQRVYDRPMRWGLGEEMKMRSLEPQIPSDVKDMMFRLKRSHRICCCWLSLLQFAEDRPGKSIADLEAELIELYGDDDWLD